MGIAYFESWKLKFEFHPSHAGEGISSLAGRIKTAQGYLPDKWTLSEMQLPARENTKLPTLSRPRTIYFLLHFYFLDCCVPVGNVAAVLANEIHKQTGGFPHSPFYFFIFVEPFFHYSLELLKVISTKIYLSLEIIHSYRFLFWRFSNWIKVPKRKNVYLWLWII